MRKYIHPNKQYKEAQNLNKHTCKMNKVFKYKKTIPTKNNLTLIQLIRWMNNKLFQKMKYIVRINYKQIQYLFKIRVKIRFHVT